MKTAPPTSLRRQGERVGGALTSRWGDGTNLKDERDQRAGGEDRQTDEGDNDTGDEAGDEAGAHV